MAMKANHVQDEASRPIVTQQQLLIQNTRIKVASTQCQALKADDTQCTYKPSEWVDGSDVSAHVCGTHYNQFNRNGHIMTIVGEISVSSEADTNVTNQVADIEKEEGTVDNGIYMFTKEVWYTGAEEQHLTVPRIVTNYLHEEGHTDGSKSEKERYNKSFASHKPYEHLLALVTGNWFPYLLQKRLHEAGYKFRILIYSNKEIAKIFEIGAGDRIAKMHEACVFSGANDSHTYFLMVEGVDEWGLEFMGIKIRDVRKIAKRLGEIFRITELFWYSPDDRSLRIKMFDAKQLLDIKHYDGANIMTVSTALRMTHVIPNVKRRHAVRRMIKNGELSRVNARLIFPLGLIKGDWLIVEDNDKWDVLVHPENIKPEFASNGWMSLTAEPHHPYHMAVWDDQTWINHRTLLPEWKQEADLNQLITDIEDSFQQGVVPDWLLLGEDAHLDDGTPNMERLSELLDRQYIRWQAAGLDIKAASNLVFMATNGICQRMTKFAHRDDQGRIQYFKKTWTPMTNAFLASVMTREVVENMAGLRLPNTDGLIWNAQVGLIMSGERFAETYNLHGGWDLDDSVKVILIKVFCSDHGKLLRLIQERVIDGNLDIPKAEEHAVHVALLVRSPNGPGEYSIEKLDDYRSMPWHQFSPDRIPVVDLADAPEAQSTLLESVTRHGLPTSLEYTGLPLTKEQCWAMIDAQRFNPGIGAVCNSLMNWSMTHGPSFPSDMLDVLEEMVDATQQGRDPVSFDAVSNEVDSLYTQMVDEVVATDGRVDRLLGRAHPIPQKFRDKLSPYMMDGRFTRYNRLYLQKYNYLMKLVRNNSLQMRASVPLVREMHKLNVSGSTLAWARDFNARYTTQLSTNDHAWPTNENTNPFIKMHYQFMKSEINKKIVAAAVSELRRKFEGDDLHKRVLCLWHYVLKPTDYNALGRLDRLIFQPGEDESIMDLLIEALRWYGKIS